MRLKRASLGNFQQVDCVSEPLGFLARKHNRRRRFWMLAQTCLKYSFLPSEGGRSGVSKIAGHPSNLPIAYCIRDG